MKKKTLSKMEKKRREQQSQAFSSIRQSMKSKRAGGQMVVGSRVATAPVNTNKRPLTDLYEKAEKSVKPKIDQGGRQPLEPVIPETSDAKILKQAILAIGLGLTGLFAVYYVFGI